MTIDHEIFQALPEKPLLRIDEVADFFSVTARTVYNWYESEKLSGCNISGTLRIYRASVIELVSSTHNKKNGGEPVMEVEEKMKKKTTLIRRVYSPGVSKRW